MRSQSVFCEAGLESDAFDLYIHVIIVIFLILACFVVFEVIETMSDYPLEATSTGKPSILHDETKQPAVATVRDNARAGAVETDPHKDLTLWKSVKKWPKVVLYCVGLTFAILMYGYDYAIVGTTSAMPSFQ